MAGDINEPGISLLTPFTTSWTGRRGDAGIGMRRSITALRETVQGILAPPNQNDSSVLLTMTSFGFASRPVHLLLEHPFKLADFLS
jgi:hypothetical protein